MRTSDSARASPELWIAGNARAGAPEMQVASSSEIRDKVSFTERTDERRCAPPKHLAIHIAATAAPVPSRRGRRQSSCTLATPVRVQSRATCLERRVEREIPFIKKLTPQAPTRTEQSTRKPARLTIL
jgi:hypothetical protein